MIILPAIDLIGGKCVRLKQGRYDDVTVYNDSPLDQAFMFKEAGASWIHVVDEFPVENKPARVGLLYGVHYIPSYFLLDKEGKVIGKMDHEELEAKLAELLD